MINIQQKPAFKKVYKKLFKNQLSEVNAAIKAVMAEPALGEEKKGDLARVLVHKFEVQNQEFLLAYQVDESTLTLLALSVHENFYRDLNKNY